MTVLIMKNSILDGLRNSKKLLKSKKQLRPKLPLEK